MDSYDTTEEERQLVAIQKKIEYKKQSKQTFQKLLAKLTFPNKKQTRQIVQKNADNLVITADTQVGKTKIIIDCMKETTDNALKVFVCDNKKDQMIQMKNRCIANNINCNTLSYMKRRTMEELALSDNINIVMLNNDKQIQRLINFCMYLFHAKKPTSVLLFFDEGDTVSKTDNTQTIVAKDPISHKKWIELHNLIRDNSVDYFKRIFISATPENCQYLYDIPLENIFTLTKPSTYRPISLHMEWNDELQPLIAEVNRITHQGSREAILYCVDMINTNQDTKARELGRYVKCPIIVYNANSITVRKYINGRWYRYTTKQTISDVLADLQEESDGPVVVVGYKLMDRGLSYVSSIPRDVDDKPLTATIMFFHGGNTAHTVGITQRFGRITGTSRPDITRRVVYCKKTFYDAYERYLQNQKKIQELCELSPKDATFAEMMKNIKLNNLQRPLDRPSLKRVNSYYKECSSSDSDNNSDYSSDVQEERIKQLIDMWWNKDTIIGKILKFVYESGSVSETELKEFILDLNADNTWYNDLHHKNKYYINVFERSQNRITKLNEKAVHYINIRYT